MSISAHCQDMYACQHFFTPHSCVKFMKICQPFGINQSGSFNPTSSFIWNVHARSHQSIELVFLFCLNLWLLYKSGLCRGNVDLKRPG